MVKEDCIYYSFQIEGAGAYSQCMNCLPGLCPCEDCNNYIVLEKIEAFSLITFKYLTIEFEENFTFFNYKFYKEAISSSI